MISVPCKGLPDNIFLVSIRYLLNLHRQRLIKKKKDQMVSSPTWLSNCVGRDKNSI